jgi:hypothetical protein
MGAAANIAQTLFKSAEVFLTLFEMTHRPGQKVLPIYGLSGALNAVPVLTAKRPEKSR